jgi:hypothetical protein
MPNNDHAKEPAMSTTTAATKNALPLSPAPSDDPDQLPTGAAKTPRLTPRKAGWVAGGALLVVFAAAAGTVSYRAQEPSQSTTSVEDKSATTATGGVPRPANVPAGSLVRAATPVGRAHAINLPPTVVVVAPAPTGAIDLSVGQAHAINLP